MTRRSNRSAGIAVPAVFLATLWLSGCALIQPPPVPTFGKRSAGGDAACGSSISQAHAALASAGAAAGDPAATAAAHAASAAAMHEYHTCLARSSR